jgi:hypothetical protein
MPEHAALVDVESFLHDRLSADDELVAVVAGRLSTELPKTFPKSGEARVQFFRVGGSPDPSDGPGHLDRPSVQFSCYGSSKEEAFDVAAAALAAVLELEGATAAGVVVTRVVRNLGPMWSPDPATGAPRYLLGVILTVHPARQ